MATGNIIQSSHRFHGPCSACGDGDVNLEYHDHESPPPRYTLPELKQLAAEYADEHEGAARLSVQVMADKLIEWIGRKEKEGTHGRDSDGAS